MARVSVVIATWNRGQHLLPTLQSALAQTYRDFEIIVVGDGCSDDTASILQPYLSENLRWINLKHNNGSQSFANNAGIAAARGDYIAYLGHDDVWAPHHLADLVQTLEASPALDFAIAGALLHGPEGSGVASVTGLFADSAAAAHHFFPPTSIMHRRSVVGRIGLWRAPWRCERPVDSEFQLRAVEAGLKFRSTQRISAHKFTAGQRYLSYLVKSSDEQQNLLQRLQHGYARQVAALVATAKQQGLFMHLDHGFMTGKTPGASWRLARSLRGIETKALQPVEGQVALDQSAEPKALDWNDFEPELGLRWSGPNPRPRLLVPFVHKHPVLVAIIIGHIAPLTRKRFAVRVNGQAVKHAFVKQQSGGLTVEFQAQLNTDAPSVFEFTAVADPESGSIRSLAIGRMVLLPMVPVGFAGGVTQYKVNLAG